MTGARLGDLYDGGITVDLKPAQRTFIFLAALFVKIHRSGDADGNNK